MVDLNFRISRKPQPQQPQLQQEDPPPSPCTTPPTSLLGRIKWPLSLQLVSSSASPQCCKSKELLKPLLPQQPQNTCTSGRRIAPRCVLMVVTLGLVCHRALIFLLILLSHNNSNDSGGSGFGYSRTMEAPFASSPALTNSSELALPTKANQLPLNGNDDEQRRKPKKPIIYIDIGPYKTGTKFIQCALARNGYDFLKQDNMLYLGTCTHSCMRRGVNGKLSENEYEICLPHSGSSIFTSDKSVVPSLHAKLDELRRDGTRNALLVWEYFSDIHEERIQNLMSVLEGWDVRLIIHYRRLYEWMPSMFSQMHRPLRGRDQYWLWPGDSYDQAVKRRRVQGVARAPFDMYTPEECKDLHLSSRYIGILKKIMAGVHPVADSRNRWIKYVTNITIVDMHHLIHVEGGRGDPLLMHLFCHVIPSLNRTCEAVKRNKFEILDHGRNLRFESENYDMLGVYAHQLGLHPRGVVQLKRPEVWRMIQGRQEKHLKKTSTDFPQKCISTKSLELLFNYSVSTESALLHTGFEAEHRESFDRAVRERRFCHIDTNLTLAHRDWRGYFRPFA